MTEYERGWVAAIEAAAAAVVTVAERPGKGMSGTNRNYLYRARDAIRALSNQAPPTSQDKSGAPKSVVCEKCNDTHWVADERYKLPIMCTSCPTPCQRCRAGGTGPYCEKTPCGCDCHAKRAPLVCPTCGRDHVPDCNGERPDCGGGK